MDNSKVGTIFFFFILLVVAFYTRPTDIVGSGFENKASLSNLPYVWIPGLLPVLAMVAWLGAANDEDVEDIWDFSSTSWKPLFVDWLIRFTALCCCLAVLLGLGALVQATYRQLGMALLAILAILGLVLYIRATKNPHWD